MKKLAILLSGMLSFNAFASECKYGIGAEGSFNLKSSKYTEAAAGQWQRSFRNIALGAKCDKVTFSTTNFALNKGYDVEINGKMTSVKSSRWTVGYQFKEWYSSKWQFSVGGSLTKITNEVGGKIDRYTQPHIVFGAAHKSGVATFVSLGRKDGETLGAVGVYYIFGGK